MTDAKLRDKYYSEEVRPVQKPQTYPNLNGGEKNRSFLTCKVKPEAQKTTGHVETRGKTRRKCTTDSVCIPVCNEAAGEVLLSGKVHQVNVVNRLLFRDYGVS